MAVDTYRLLSHLSDVYARKYNIKVCMQGNTAYTTGRLIVIPRIDLSKPDNRRMVCGYLAHEGGHIRYTNFRGVKAVDHDKLLKMLFNIVEDARIERLMGRDMLGVHENLEFIHEHGWASFKRAAEEPRAVPILELLLVTIGLYAALTVQRFNIYRHETAVFLRELRRRTPHRMVTAVMREVRSIAKCENSAQALKCTRTIYKLIAEQLIDTTRSEFATPEELQALLAWLGQDYDADTEYAELVSMKPTSDFVKALYKFLAACDGDTASVMQPEPLKELMQDLVDRDTTSRDDWGSMEPEVASGAYNAKFLAMAMRNEPELVAALRSRVIAYVDGHSQRTALRGKHVDAVRAQFVPYGETRVFLPHVYQEDYSTAVCVIYDVSGSMLTCDNAEHSRCEYACMTAFSMCRALDGISGVRSVAMCFPGRGAECCLVKDFDQSMAARGMYFGQKARGSTPMAQTLCVARRKLMSLCADRKILVVITDGIPDSVENAHKQIAACEKDGIELYGFGIQLDFIGKLIKHSCNIKANDELSRKVLETLLSIYDARHDLALEAA